FALGETMGALYQRALQQAARMSKEQREARREEAKRSLRDPALHYLRRSEGAAVEVRAFGEALIAYYEGHLDAALARAREAQTQAPWSFDALELEGEIHIAAGLEQEEHGGYDEAMRRYDLAGRAFAAAQSLARSHPDAHEGDCRRFLRVVYVERQRGG